jgi:hypothetical protein
VNDEKTDSKATGDKADETLPAWLELVREKVDSLKFGTVQITVHESRVTQVERLENLRLDRPAGR